MSTIHRKDITGTEFTLLGNFCKALRVLENQNGNLQWVLGEVVMWLPVWYRSGTQWRLADYRPFRREAFGLEMTAMRRICNYLGVKESEMIRTLYRLSMLAVVPNQRILAPPRFRMPFFGIEIDYKGFAAPSDSFGFVIERRRAEGNFKADIGFRNNRRRW